MHIVQVVTCPSNVKNGQSNITLVGCHGQPKFTSNIVHCITTYTEKKLSL